MAGAIDRVAPWRQTAWDWRAVGNFIGGGSGTGLLVVAAIAAGPTYPAQALIGMVLVCAGLLCVWLEIGRPWRALNVFRHVHTSWMTREALLAPLLLAVGVSAVISGGSILAWMAAALALAYLYCRRACCRRVAAFLYGGTRTSFRSCSSRDVRKAQVGG